MKRVISASLMGLGMNLMASGCSSSETLPPVQIIYDQKGAEDRLEFAVQARDNVIERQIGKTCAQALSDYMPHTEGETLSNDAVVVQLALRDPTRPCGSDPDGISHARDVLAAHEAAIEFARADLERAETGS